MRTLAEPKHVCLHTICTSLFKEPQHMHNIIDYSTYHFVNNDPPIVRTPSASRAMHNTSNQSTSLSGLHTQRKGHSVE